jgi:hypothetical protein
MLKFGIFINPPTLPRMKFKRAISAKNPISMASTFKPTFRPSEQPADMASITLVCSFATFSFTSPLVSEVSVSGNISFAMAKAPGAAIILAAMRYSALTPNWI